MREKINPFANRKKRYSKLDKYTKFSRPAKDKKTVAKERRAAMRGE